MTPLQCSLGLGSNSVIGGDHTYARELCANIYKRKGCFLL